MLIVDTDVVLVERQLRAGELTCPSCGAVLAPWGHGQPREIRGDLGSRLFVRPRRSRCTGCQVTHVLLPEMMWPRRMDAAEVIGAGLEIAALGMGHRQVAAHLGLAEDTVRGWIRRFRRRSEDVRRYFTVAPCGLRPQGFFHSTTSSTTVTPSCSSSASRNTVRRGACLLALLAAAQKAIVTDWTTALTALHLS